MKASKYLFFAIIFSLFLFSSCSADDEDLMPTTGIIETDNPPKGLYINDTDYGSFQKVYVKNENLVNPLFFGKFQEGYSTNYDHNGNVVVNLHWTDLYKISSRKYYGVYNGFIYISKSEVYVLINIYDLENIKKIIEKKGGAFAQMGDYAYSNNFPRVYPTGD